MIDVEFHHSSAELYGSDRSLLGLVAEFGRRQKSVRVRLPQHGPLSARLAEIGAAVEEGVSVVLRRQSSSPRGAVGVAIDLVGRARQDRRSVGEAPRLVVSNTSTVLSGYVRSRQCGARHVVIVREWYKSDLERMFFALLVGRADRVICVSESVRTQFRGFRRLTRKSHVVHSGADLASLAGLAKKNVDGSPSRLRVLCPGRINSWKGQEVLIAALGELRRRGVFFSTKIVGSEYGGGEHRLASLKELVAIHEVDVEFIPEVPDLQDMYEWSDIVVVPSTGPEPFGKVVVEGLAAGRVVVASDIAGPSEVVRDMVDGMLFRVGDHSHLADRLHIISQDDRIRQALASAAPARAWEFDQDALSRRSVDVMLDQQ